MHKDGEGAVEILLTERVDGKEHQSIGRCDTGVNDAVNDLVVQALNGVQVDIVDQHAEFFARDVVAAARDQYGLWCGAEVDDLVHATHQFIELPDARDHSFDGVTPMSRRLDVVTVVVVESGEDVMDGIVEPGVANGQQIACRLRGSGNGSEAAAASETWVSSVLMERG